MLRRRAKGPSCCDQLEHNRGAGAAFVQALTRGFMVDRGHLIGTAAWSTRLPPSTPRPQTSAPGHDRCPAAWPGTTGARSREVERNCDRALEASRRGGSPEKFRPTETSITLFWRRAWTLQSELYRSRSGTLESDLHDPCACDALSEALPAAARRRQALNRQQQPQKRGA
jgi:hypothetical protein